MTQQSELIYRSNLESVYEYIEKTHGDERRLLGIKDVCCYTGRSYNTVKKKYFEKDKKDITAETFARKLANL